MYKIYNTNQNRLETFIATFTDLHVFFCQILLLINFTDTIHPFKNTVHEPFLQNILGLKKKIVPTHLSYVVNTEF